MPSRPAGRAGRLAPTSGRPWARIAATPAVTAAAALVPLTVPNRTSPSSPRPGSDVGTETPGAATSGLTLPSKVSPRDENAAIDPRPSRSATSTSPIATVTGTPAAIRERISRTSPSASPTTGTPAGTSRLNAPAGSGPSTTTARAPAAVASSTVSSESTLRGSRAARPATALTPSVEKSPPIPFDAVARFTNTTPAVTVLEGAPPRGTVSSKSTLSPART